MPARVLVIMGVSSSGKTTVGCALTDSLGWHFTDADDFHPPANIAKLSAGTALTDSDRAPWLAAVRAHIEAQLSARIPNVIACSALITSYRAQLIANSDQIGLVYLRGTHQQLAARLNARTGHFVPPALLASQLATLEAPRDALILDIALSPAELATTIRRHFQL
jgi:gluconokinase